MTRQEIHLNTKALIIHPDIKTIIIIHLKIKTIIIRILIKENIQQTIISTTTDINQIITIDINQTKIVEILITTSNLKG